MRSAPGGNRQQVTGNRNTRRGGVAPPARYNDTKCTRAGAETAPLRECDSGYSTMPRALRAAPLRECGSDNSTGAWYLMPGASVPLLPTAYCLLPTASKPPPPHSGSGGFYPPGHFANSTARVSRTTLTLICPGYSISASMRLTISRARMRVPASLTSSGLTITRISRPDCMA